jgi:hypothetical protein
LGHNSKSLANVLINIKGVNKINNESNLNIIEIATSVLEQSSVSNSIASNVM